MIPIPTDLPLKVDLYSDTLTRPSDEMREVMAAAAVGDEQKGEDPSTNELLDLVKALLGKEEAVFLPSGTMCNEIAFAAHCRPGDEILLDEKSHALQYEGGGPAALAGALVRPLPGERGVFTARQLEGAIKPVSRYTPRTRLVSVEQPSVGAAGHCWTLPEIRDVTEAAHRHGLRTHLDGARLFNAVVATGTSAREFADGFDSAWIDLSKGLGAPFGGVLAGDREFITEAWRLKQRWGGAMRQSGIMAAAGTFALRHNIDRLAEDHENARVLADRLAASTRISVDPIEVETNIVLFDLVHTEMSAMELNERLIKEAGVRVSAFGPSTVRAVTHLDVSTPDILYAADAIAGILAA
ncbi:threonine aldolase family protein [Amycolatopsis pithecellobii]|uniref:Aminotransferase class I/II-fold pyridoxal phosphate-dependent enzyme n=1 Tax=Amycolatopsis pithecellobii TaxID=664692 RepID=A0A6N7Z877_9PSEU|nr:GntG family PLP-dependent aldolase [Amycolatopsis pithecellobii]MTD57610.1 aminotransferase class I/II-fold pyridoxal phosphate-dependent enzyme [Amycolatopsis pithecellobii]